jgi:DNA-binding GntR family transcriptional regulator
MPPNASPKTAASAEVPRDPAPERFARIYTELRNRICTNRYPPGTVLNETELADEFGLSRTPIRSVLQKLNHDGLVETRNGVGTFVSEVDERTAEDLYRLRMKLAELIGEFSPSVATTDQISRFESLLQRAEKLPSKPNYKAIGEINVAVAEAIADLSQSAALKELTTLLYFRTARIWHKTIPELDWNEECALVKAELNEILRSLRMSDVASVGFIRRNFIAMAFKRLQSALRRSGG